MAYPFIPGPTAPTIVGGTGSELLREDGTTILDMGGGAIVVNIGHGRREIAEVGARALGEMAYVVPPWPTPAREALVERIRGRWLPDALTQVALVSGGSESVDTAMRVVRLHHVAAGRPERWKVIGRETSYHGVTLAALLGGHDRRRAGYEPLLLDLPKAPAADPRSGIDAADALDRLIQTEGPDTVAAFVAEPIVGSAGAALTPPDDYWPRVAEICRHHGVLLVADEVMCGFGRLGRAFGVETWDVVPDVITGGKGLGGGYVPIGGVYARPEVTDPIAAAGESLMFFTGSATHVACAVADRVLEILEDEDLVGRAAEMGGVLRGMLDDALGDHPHVADVRGLGLMQGVELGDVPDGFTTRLVAEGLRRGVWYYPCGSAGVPEAVMFGPPFVVSEDELARGVETLVASIDAVLADTTD